MIYYKSRLLFGAVKRVVILILKAAYKVLSFFNLQFTLFVGVIGAILYLTGTFESSHAVLTAFYFAVIVSILAGMGVTLKKLFSGSGVKKSKGVQIVDKTANEPCAKAEIAEQREEFAEKNGDLPVVTESETPVHGTGEDKPKISRVKGHPQYYMAEYRDRYELYKKTASGYVKIRADYKTREIN